MSEIKTCRIVAAMSFVCLFAGARAFGIDGAPSWHLSTVRDAAPDTFVASPSLAFDHLGMPSVSWASVSAFGGTSTVYRSELSGLGLWAHRTVASGFGVGRETSLSFDRAERPVVAWTTNALEIYADYNNGQIQQRVASDAGADSHALSLAHDLAGNLRGLYGSSGNQLMGINFDGAAFTSASLATLADIDHFVDAQLATDFTGLRHAVVRAEMPGGTECIVISSEPSFTGAWPTATLTTADAVGGISIATNPVTGKVGIAYSIQNAGLSQLMLAELDGFTLESTLVRQTSTSVYEDISLAYDRTDGRPAIAFEENALSGGESLSLAYLDGTAQWQSSLVDDSIRLDALDGLLKPSLAFDDYGTSYPAVAYVDDNGSLIVAFDPPAVPEPTTAALLIVVSLGVSRRRRRH